MASGILADHGVELLKLVCGLAGSSPPGSSLPDTRPTDAETLRLRCDHLLAEWVARCQRAGADAAHLDAAKYAWVALIDERILGAHPTLAAAWLASPLQLRHFDSFNAGEEFFTRLETLRHPRTAEAADPLEVYHLCLCLGFTGKHGDEPGRERRRLLVEQITGEILSARGAGSAALSPRWKTTGTPFTPPATLRWKGLPVWLVPLVLAGVLLLLAVAMDALIANRAASFARDLPGHST